MQKNLQNILCFITILLLSVSSLFLYNEYKKNTSSIKSLNQKITDLEKQIADAKNKPPAGWNEYINEKYKFKMWYPEEVSDDIYGLENVGVNNSNTAYYIYNSSKPESENPIYGISFFLAIVNDYPQPRILDIYVYNNNKDIKEFIKNNIKIRQPDIIKKYSDSEIISSIQQIKSENLDLYRFGDKLNNTYLKKDDLVFVFEWGSGSVPTNSQFLFDQMIQSFRFID